MRRPNMRRSSAVSCATSAVNLTVAYTLAASSPRAGAGASARAGAGGGDGAFGAGVGPQAAARGARASKTIGDLIGSSCRILAPNQGVVTPFTLLHKAA